MDQLSSVPIRTLVLDDEADSGEVIAGLLRAEPGFAVTVAPVAFGEGPRAARRAEPDVVVLVVEHLVGSDPFLVLDELENAAPHAAVVVLGPSDAAQQHEFILAGARACLKPPYSRETLVASVRQIHQTESRRRERLAASIQGDLRRHRCLVIAVHGAKGGVGTTTVAVNLAVGLRELTGERIAIVDASMQTGDVGVALNLAINATIDDLLPRLSGLDADLLNKVMMTHPSGVRALLAPRDLERAEAIGGDELRRILTFLTAHFDYIIIDTAPVIDGASLRALDHADQVLLVTTPEIPALKNSGRFLQLSRRLGYPPDKVSLVVNRAHGAGAIQLPEIQKQLGVKPVAAIPDAARVFVRATNHGELVVGGPGLGGPGRSLRALCRRLAVTAPPSRRPSLLARLPLLERVRSRPSAGRAEPSPSGMKAGTQIG